MIDWNSLWIFVPVALALNLTPGADMLFCLAQGAKSGPRAGIAASFGIATGSFLHALAGGLGLAALLAAYPAAFEVVRWSGVSYLVYLAINAFRSIDDLASPASVDKANMWKAWREGIFVCLFNPKVAIFILALVPQFVDPARGSVLVQFLIFGTILNIGGTIINAAVGMFAGQMGQFLARTPSAQKLFGMLSSLIFIGLAIKLAWSR